MVHLFNQGNVDRHRVLSFQYPAKSRGYFLHQFFYTHFLHQFFYTKIFSIFYTKFFSFFYTQIFSFFTPNFFLFFRPFFFTILFCTKMFAFLHQNFFFFLHNKFVFFRPNVCFFLHQIFYFLDQMFAFFTPTFLIFYTKICAFLTPKMLLPKNFLHQILKFRNRFFGKKGVKKQKIGVKKLIINTLMATQYRGIRYYFPTLVLIYMRISWRHFRVDSFRKLRISG